MNILIDVEVYVPYTYIPNPVVCRYACNVTVLYFWLYACPITSLLWVFQLMGLHQLLQHNTVANEGPWDKMYY